MPLIIAVFFLFYFLLPNISFSQTGPEIVKRSIEYHDPDNHWPRLSFSWEQETRLYDSSYIAIVGEKVLASGSFNLRNGDYFRQSNRDGRKIEYIIDKNGCYARIAGMPDPSRELRKKYQLDCDGARNRRDYDAYLLGLPMKLNDPGTNIHLNPDKAMIGDQEYQTVKVTYAEPMGSESWVFYFHPESHALAAARFYRDPSETGEIIIFKEEEDVKGILLPLLREWYWYPSMQPLAEDRYEVVKAKVKR